jgi:hypothetical protein
MIEIATLKEPLEWLKTKQDKNGVIFIHRDQYELAWHGCRFERYDA